jgi:hypothetical protein
MSLEAVWIDIWGKPHVHVYYLSFAKPQPIPSRRQKMFNKAKALSRTYRQRRQYIIDINTNAHYSFISKVNK